MIRIGTLCTILAFIAICLVSSPAVGQDDLDALKYELRDVQMQINGITNTYNRNISSTRTATEKKLAALKKEFHKNRAKYINEKKAEEARLLSNYNQEIRPLKAQENALRNKIEPKEGNNFAKR